MRRAPSRALLGAAGGRAVRGLRDVEPVLRRAQTEVAQALDRLAERDGEPAGERNLDAIGATLRFGGALRLGGESGCRGERQRERRERDRPTQHVDCKMQNRRQRRARSDERSTPCAAAASGDSATLTRRRFHDGGGLAPRRRTRRRRCVSMIPCLGQRPRCDCWPSYWRCTTSSTSQRASVPSLPPVSSTLPLHAIAYVSACHSIAASVAAVVTSRTRTRPSRSTV